MTCALCDCDISGAEADLEFPHLCITCAGDVSDEADADCGLCRESGLSRCICDAAAEANDITIAALNDDDGDDECDFTEEDLVT